MENLKSDARTERRAPYALVEEVLRDAPEVAFGVRCLILLRVPLKECNGYIGKMTGKTIGPQALKTLATKRGGVLGITGSFANLGNTFSREEQSKIFLSAREYAKAAAPLFMWRTDPAIHYCLRDLLIEECTADFTINRKAGVVHDVLKDQGIQVEVGTIRKVLEHGGYEPDESLRALYPKDFIENMRTRALEQIAISQKTRVDNLYFEHAMWKDRPLCIKITEAISQGASVNALSVLAGNSGYTFKPGSFQAFMRRYKVDDEAITSSSNRAAAVAAVRELRSITDGELGSVRMQVSKFIEEYKNAVSRDMARANEFVRGTQSRAGLAVLRGHLTKGSLSTPLNDMVTFSVARKDKKRALIVTTYPMKIDVLRKEYAEQLKAGLVVYSEGHSLIDFDNMMYVLKGLASLRVISPPGEYKTLLNSVGADTIEFRESRPPSTLEESVEIPEGDINVNSLFDTRRKFILPSAATVSKTQFLIRTKRNGYLRDMTLSEKPLRLGFRRAHYHNDAAFGVQYVADIIDDTNTTVATLLCSRSEEGLHDWLKEQGVTSLQYIEQKSWLQRSAWAESREQVNHVNQDAAE